MLLYDEEAEQAILGSILLKNDSFYQASDYLDFSDFFSQKHQEIFKSIDELIKEESVIDDIIIGDVLKQKGELENCGGYQYLNELKDVCLTPDNISYYVEIVKNYSVKRDLFHSMQHATKSFQNEGSANEILKYLSQLLLKSEDKISEGKDECYSLSSLIEEEIKDVEKRLENPELDFTGLKTGFLDLDNWISGFQKGDLIIIAARPSMGKTSFATSIALGASENTNESILIFSAEMTKEQIAQRFICSSSDIDLSVFRKGNLSQKNWDDFSIFMQNSSNINKIFLNDQALNIRKLESSIYQFNRKNPLSLVIVDYLQLLSSTGKHQNREQEVSEISRTLKRIAKKINVPVIALAQLNRDLEKRADKRPLASDLRDSGSIEQDADLLIFLYRDEVYTENSSYKGICELIIRKFRNGNIGTIPIGFSAKYTKFFNLNEVTKKQFLNLKLEEV